MGFISFLNHWWNVPYLVLLGLVLVFFALQLLGLGHKEVHKEVDAPSHDADADHDHEAEGFAWGDVLAFFGVGRVPFMVIWLTLFVFEGFTGIAVNAAIFDGGYPWWAFPLSLLVALVVGLFAVRIATRLAARLVDTGGRGATAKHELAGKQGVVASATVDEKFGEVRVKVDGDEQLVHGRLESGEKPLLRGARVVIVEYDAASGLFWVAPSPDLGEEA